jgi:aryl-alcohol dehydrogenase-like predicted oxidoreductase
MVEIPDKRPLGRSGVAIAPLMFGGNVFGWTVNEDQSFAILDGFLAAGFDSIDTADVYSRWIAGNTGGESETILGKWMQARGNRGDVIIATKCGSEMGPGQKGLSKQYIRDACARSLERLQTKYIDLYQAHRPDPDTPIEETLEGFASLIEEGKVRVIGASNYSPAQMREALDASRRLGLPRYETLQPLYTLSDRNEFESGYAALCRQENISVIPYYGLAAGFLTGKYRHRADANLSPRGETVVSRYLNPRGERILGALDEVALAYGVQPAAVALAWLMAQPTIAAPIASVTTLKQLADFSDAARLELGEYALQKLNQASAP